MRRHLPVAVFLAALAVQFDGGEARADCAASMTEFDDVYCFAKTYIAADDDLNAAYKALAARLEPDAKAVLKKSQLAWIKQRNEECGETSSDGYAVHLSCAIDYTRNRAKFLHDRTAECDAGECDMARLAEANS